MERIDPEDVLHHPRNWAEISREKALIHCEFDPVVAVYTVLGHRRAGRVGFGSLVQHFKLYLEAPGTKFYQLIEQKRLTRAQLQQREELIAAQDAARKNPEFLPTAIATHCNQATLAIAKAVKAPTADIGVGLLANEAAKNLKQSGAYREVSSQEAQEIANEGGFVIAVWANPIPKLHGHETTVRPEGVPGDTPVPGHGPLLNNIGNVVKVQYASAVFPTGASVLYYTPK